MLSTFAELDLTSLDTLQKYQSKMGSFADPSDMLTPIFCFLSFICFMTVFERARLHVKGSGSALLDSNFSKKKMAAAGSYSYFGTNPANMQTTFILYDLLQVAANVVVFAKLFAVLYLVPLAAAQGGNGAFASKLASFILRGSEQTLRGTGGERSKSW
jgi:hypothetical protein